MFSKTTSDEQIQPIAEKTLSSINQSSQRRSEEEVLNEEDSPDNGLSKGDSPSILEAQNESSLADMEVDSGSSLEVSPELKKSKEQRSVKNNKNSSSGDSFVADALEFISATSPSRCNDFSYQDEISGANISPLNLLKQKRLTSVALARSVTMPFVMHCLNPNKK